MHQVLLAVNGLRMFGFTHLNIHPGNVVVNFKPIDASLIDFNTVSPTSDQTKDMHRGDDPYVPSIDVDWVNGDVKHDFFALTVIGFMIAADIN